MKKTDIAMIILIAAVCVLLSFFIVRAVIGEGSTEVKKVQTIEKIESAIEPMPDERIFNTNAINPSVEVELEPRSAAQGAVTTPEQ